MLYEIKSKTVHSDEEDDKQRKKKHESEVKPVENIRKNLHRFLEISPVQNEFLPSH